MKKDTGFKNMCRAGQVLLRKHELMRDEFQNANSMDCFQYEDHIAECNVCREALGLKLFTKA